MAEQTARLDDGVDAALAYLNEHRDKHLAELQEFVRIASVSADPAYAKDVRRGADWLAMRLADAGLEDVDIIETTGHPAVIASWDHAGPDAPTLLVYGHYDVQPAAKEDGWQRDPFGAEIADDRMWGRGTTDDKGQLMCHVLAVEAWLKTAGKLPINVRMVVEGEEEAGSASFEEVIDKAEDRLKADLLVVSDSMMRDEETPAITHTLRGLSYMLVDVDGPRSDMHSGTWGGVVWNPNDALVHMLATLKDPKTGRILVKGFYDDVVEPSEGERQRLAAISDSEEAYLEGTGSSALFGEEGWTSAERVGLRPTLDINGLRGGYTGEGSKTVIPRTAHAKVSCRLVADQDPHRVYELVKAHLESVAPEGVTVRVEMHSFGHPVRTDPTHPLVRRAEAALAATWKNPPALVPEGGTIPAVADMQRRLGVLPVMIGFGLKDENMHAPDESFRLKNYWRGQEASVRLIAELARGGS